MRKKIHIELFEEGENANIYSYRVNDGDLEIKKGEDQMTEYTSL